MEQQERFAVAIIGFAIKHDAGFRDHFLGTVCGFDHLPDGGGWEVTVEPENWGDLVLKHRASRLFVVAEFKIGAGLANHQNPSEARFNQPWKDGKCAGYGWEIDRIAAMEKWSQLRYVTVETKASWSKVKRENRRLACMPVEWKRFVRASESDKSKIEADVYDSLSRFGISIFAARRMKEMKLATQATQPLALLKGVLAKFGVEFRTKLLNDVNDEAFGFNIYEKDFPKLAGTVDPQGKCAGWFGYESSAPLGPRCSVWFYCYTSKGMKTAARTRIEKALRKSGFKASEFCDDGYSVNVWKVGGSTGDLEWFTKVLTALNN